MSDQHVEVRSVVWKEIFPWLILPRVFAIAISPPVLLCALLALLGSTLGWRAASVFVIESRLSQAEVNARAYGDETLRLYEDVEQTSLADVHYLRDWPVEASRLPPWLARGSGEKSFLGLTEGTNPLLSAASYYADPWLHLLTPAGERTWKEFAFYLSGGLWSLLVWSLFAGAITRIAALRLGRDERLGFLRAVTYSSRRITQYFSAPLLPLLGVLLLAILPALCGLLMRISFFAAIGGVLWFLALLFGLLITLLVIGLAFGWPLMWPAISTEGRNGDAFDAFSRSYNYTYTRPLHYLFYVIITALVGILGWMLVNVVAVGVEHLGYWAVSLGSGGAQVQALATAANGGNLDSSMLEFGGKAIGFWVGLVHATANAFAFAFFWCGATAIYLLLRRDIDQAEIEAVEASDEMPISPLPPLEAQRPDPRGG